MEERFLDAAEALGGAGQGCPLPAAERTCHTCGLKSFFDRQRILSHSAF